MTCVHTEQRRTVLLFKPVFKQGQVPTVRRQGVVAETPLHPEAVDETLYLRRSGHLDATPASRNQRDSFSLIRAALPLRSRR